MQKGGRDEGGGGGGEGVGGFVLADFGESGPQFLPGEISVGTQNACARPELRAGEEASHITTCTMSYTIPLSSTLSAMMLEPKPP